MSIRDWSNDYVSGFSDIDAQNRNLFQIINTFAEENNESVPQNTLFTFLESLRDYAEEHFFQEENLMRENNYPLKEYHANLHRNLELTITKITNQLKNNALKEPFVTLITFTADWLNNHIAKNDRTFFNFCKNKDSSLSEKFIGKKCEVSRISNEILGFGKIKSVRNNNVIIANEAEKKIPVNLNDIVKVTVLLTQLQVFIAQVFYSDPESTKLFNAVVIKSVNQRQHFRVLTDVEATLWLSNGAFPVKITDMSAAGLMIESDQLVKVQEMVAVEFTVENNSFKELCKIVHATRKIGFPNTYGLKFEAIDSSQSDKLITYLFNKQISTRQAVI